MADDLFASLDLLDDRRSGKLDRREFLTYIGASLAASACDAATGAAGPGVFGDAGGADATGIDASGRDAGSGDAGEGDAEQGDADAQSFDDLDANPFRLGVASGDPRADRVVLWTRLITDPPRGGRLPARQIPVVWEVAESRPPADGQVTREFDHDAIVRSGTTMAKPEWGHSVHVDVEGLDPDAWYTYRFRVGKSWNSRVGQTRTLPRRDARPEAFRVATACCQAWPEGYYTAHAHLAREDNLDLVFFLGDYVYEKTAGEIIRPHPTDVPATLEEFRRRYALYKAEPQLREAHAHCPWVVTWDDHEVRNNYAGTEPVQEDLSVDQFKQIRAAAYQAYYEHLPVRVPERPEDDAMKIHRQFRVGDLVDFEVLDGRQYRSGVTCSGKVERRCDEATDSSKSMLGADQREWLVGALDASSTVWNAVVQQTIFTPINFSNTVINSDMWDGYQHERQQIIDVLADRVDNPVMLTGDIHMGLLLEIPRDDDDPGDDPIAPEIVATSITSENTTDGWGSRLEDLVPSLGQVRYFNPDERGYTVVEFGRDEVRVHYRTVSTVHISEARLETDATWTIERGSGELNEL